MEGMYKKAEGGARKWKGCAGKWKGAQERTGRSYGGLVDSLGSVHKIPCVIYFYAYTLST